MKQPITPAEPRFIDEQNEVIDSLPTFATRTTLRSILQANGVKTLLELEARSAPSTESETMPPKTASSE
ncbi:hypothetical protein [Pseudomonas libanensis]|jgi:hypothetical protein|uniref:Uncharacterized protein n=1 Tax=Pseudomonas libanensis TaxID=75588 RepID=A0ABR5MCD4_9PSED|nr:hypothetical protein [Pseudomonas libanensis]KPG76997.1 hypothetical protein AEQ48_01330 [Pseudomonas libanensis]